MSGKPIELVRERSNRAITPLFRLLGGRPKPPAGEASILTDVRGHHRGEWMVYSLLVPLVTGAVFFDVLWRLGGPLAAWLGVVPATFFGLQVLAFISGVQRPASVQWRWDVMLALWALWLHWASPDSGVLWAAKLWLGLFSLHVLAGICLLWGAMMRKPVFCTNGFRFVICVLFHVPAVAAGVQCGWQWAIACLLLNGAFWCSGTFLPNSRVFGPVARRVEGDDVLLTIDDGPDPVDTPALLDLLDAHGRKAVFFVIGEKVRRFPDLAREIVSRGHELGNHSMTHPVAWFWGLGPKRTRREIEGCQQAIEEVTGVKPRWFRAPAGHRNWFTHPVLREHGLDLVGWRRRAYDTIRADVDAIVADLTRGVEKGDIVLLHEATPTSQPVMTKVLAKLPPVSGAADLSPPTSPARSGGC